MTVIIEKPAINLREELADLRNQGTYQEQQFWYENAVTNGDFAANTTGWSATAPATATWNSGAVDLARNSGSSVQNLFQTFALKVGRTYKFSINITALSNSVALYSTGGGVLIGTTSSTGVFSATKVWAAGDTGLYVGCGGSVTATATVDDILVYESDGTDIVYRLPKGWKPKDVFEDGSLQREGAAYDYEVVYDGFDYFVKPAVAPGVTTQTCVIGVRA